MSTSRKSLTRRLSDRRVCHPTGLEIRALHDRQRLASGRARLATLTCAEGSTRTATPLWFKHAALNAPVSADGRTIQGTYSESGSAWSWSFTGS